MVEAVKSMLSKPDTVKALIDMFIVVFKDQEVQKGMTGLLEECFHRILLDKETIDKFKIFFYNLMAMEIEDSKGKKSSLLDLMLTKAVARKPSQREDIKSIIESRGKPIQDQPSIQEILNATTPINIPPPGSTTHKTTNLQEDSSSSELDKKNS